MNANSPPCASSIATSAATAASTPNSARTNAADQALDHEQSATSGAGSSRYGSQTQLEVDHHADRDEEHAEQQPLERLEIDLDLMAVLAVAAAEDRRGTRRALADRPRTRGRGRSRHHDQRNRHDQFAAAGATAERISGPACNGRSSMSRRPRHSCTGRRSTSGDARRAPRSCTSRRRPGPARPSGPETAAPTARYARRHVGAMLLQSSCITIAVEDSARPRPSTTPLAAHRPCAARRRRSPECGARICTTPTPQHVAPQLPQPRQRQFQPEQRTAGTTTPSSASGSPRSGSSSVT